MAYNASIALGWDSASEWYRKRVLDSLGVAGADAQAKKQWKDLPKSTKAVVTGKPGKRAMNVFETDREKAAYAAGLARGRADLSAAAERLRQKKATRTERMMRSGLGRK
jgi:hypothetical protein